MLKGALEINKLLLISCITVIVRAEDWKVADSVCLNSSRHVLKT